MGSVRPGGTFGSSLAMVALLMMPSPSEPNYINEVVLDGDAFLRVGLNSAVVRVAPTGEPGDVCTQRVDYVIYEETQGQEPENRLMVGEDTYAVGEEVELEAGVHGFVFMLVCEKSVRCVPSVSVNDINVGITGNGSLGGGWRAFSGRLEAQEPAAGELTFLIIGDDMSMEYAFPLRIRKEGGGGGTDVEVTFGRERRRLRAARRADCGAGVPRAPVRLGVSPGGDPLHRGDRGRRRTLRQGMLRVRRRRVHRDGLRRGGRGDVREAGDLLIELLQVHPRLPVQRAQEDQRGTHVDAMGRGERDVEEGDLPAGSVPAGEDRLRRHEEERRRLPRLLRDSVQ